MPFDPGLIGAPERLHGGSIAGFLEVAAIVALRERLGAGVAIKPVNVTVDYLRVGLMRDTFAAVEITRAGRRVANLRATAWQDGRDRPIATATINALLERPAEPPSPPPPANR
ncbi:PaaI family thioesterase [Sandaracinobacteroides saxicola]|uniref:PaaI family thioesterase n=2 Tax=Sandaracinobacteroides saxicola TaxID=2759707 RepID=A0A7G5IMI3_9SPHN|nr:PaaI family thioesterase [Sandaracinobacteroides saxicola]